MGKYLDKLSEMVIDYSLCLKPNERVLITYQSNDVNELIKKLILKIIEKRGIVFTRLIDNNITSLLQEYTTDARIKEITKQDFFDVENFDSFINIRYSINDYEFKYVNDEIRKKMILATKEANDIRVNKRKWVLFNYPSILDAHKAEMPIDRYYNYALKVMTFDYQKMNNDIMPLKELMEKTDRVRIVGPNTDLSFSIKDIPVIPCCGKNNIPDGEIFTAPVKDSLEGRITFNTKAPYHGNVYHNVSLYFEKGKVIEVNCDNDIESLNKILDIDEGSRYIGEFALGLNPLILEPMGDILYDEKIIGSLHLALGRAYQKAFNGNESSIHWDMILIQRDEYGGGQIYFDDILIRENGLFVIDELKHLNYNLK